MLGLIYIQAHDKRVRLTVQVNDAGEIGPGNSADVANRHPVLGEADRLPRLEKRISLLVPKQPSLNFYISAVVIGKRLAPIETIRIRTPRPDFLGGKLGKIGEVYSSGIRVRVPHTHKRLAAS